MSIPFKALIAVLSAFLIVVSGFVVILGFSEHVAANNYMEQASMLIVESYYNDSVIVECIDRASDNGYTLTVTVEGGNKPGTAKYMKIEMNYDFELRLFGYKQPKRLVKVM